MTKTVLTAIAQIVDNLRKSLLWFFFPKKCVGCGLSGAWFCADCARRLEYTAFQRCLVCGKAAVGGYTHPECETRYTVERALAPFQYREPIRSAIHEAKYYEVWGILDELSERAVLWLEYAGIDFLPGAVLVPIPLHFLRKWERGYNQALILARCLGKRLKLPVETSFLVRKRHTQSQTSFSDKEEREKNVKGAFSCESDLTGRNIVLVDDVFSSGATLKAAAKALKKKHARTVWCLTIARS